MLDCKRTRAMLRALSFLAVLSPFSAHADLIVHKGYTAALNQQNIRTFLENMEKVANGQPADLQGADIGGYLNSHIADGATLSTVLRYELPGKPPQESNVSLSKPEYINGIVGGQGTMKDYVSTLDIQKINISGDGKTASLKTVTREQGKLAIKDQDTGEMQLVPVTGETSCNQNISVSSSNYIQIDKAVCNTTIRLDPWNGQPLAPQ